jgi:hypothetical protein
MVVLDGARDDHMTGKLRRSTGFPFVLLCGLRVPIYLFEAIENQVIAQRKLPA